MPTQPLHDDRRTALRDDLLAAAIVSVLLIPQSLAYALLAGLPPQVGLYASVLPLVAYALVGASSVNAVGPAAVLSLMTLQAIAPLAGQVDLGAAAVVLAFEVGVLLALAAALKLDALAALLSAPVLQGFSVGAAISIALAQLPALLGSPAHGVHLRALLTSWWQAAQSSPAVHLGTAAFGLGSLAVLLVARRHLQPLAARWLSRDMAQLVGRSAPLGVIAIATALAWALAAPSHGVSVVGELPTLRLPLALPLLDAELWLTLLPSAAA
jgi:sulfate permease, SulP family